MKTSSTKMLENRGRSHLRSGYLPRFCLESVADITKKAVRNELLFKCSPRGHSMTCNSLIFKHGLENEQQINKQLFSITVL